MFIPAEGEDGEELGSIKAVMSCSYLLRVKMVRSWGQQRR